MKFIISLTSIAVIALVSCVHTHKIHETRRNHAAIVAFKKGNDLTLSPQQRAAWYLDSAQTALSGMKQADTRADNMLVYNEAAAHLTMLLRAADDGKMWNRPQTLTHNGKVYRLRFAPASREGLWDPNTFTSFTPASDVTPKKMKSRNEIQGIGGTLVGVQKLTPQQQFTPKVGVTAAVTALLDFQGSDVTLRLIDPTKTIHTTVERMQQPVAADFTAPLDYYPYESELWNGLMGAIRVEQFMNQTGLYMLQPYDPDKIPLVFVHGLISTARMWRTVINDIERDPTLRGRYQCWVFGYPTGNPPAYSALRLREELAKVKQRYPNSRDYVLVGHSMGGLISQMQVKNIDRDAWNLIGKKKAQQFFNTVPTDSLVNRAVIFQANPNIDRVVFICTPHRGSKMAIGTVGELAMRLIALPANLTVQFTSAVSESVGMLAGTGRRLPNSVSGLSPKNPTLKVLDSRPMTVPHHSIIGDRGKGDTPLSSDGVVEYWSSTMRSAQSEKIVPCPHGACEMPETISELQRILHLHLKEQGNNR